MALEAGVEEEEAAAPDAAEWHGTGTLLVPPLKSPEVRTRAILVS